MKKIVLALLVVSFISIGVLAQTTFELQQPSQNEKTIQWLSFVKEACSPCQEGQMTKFDINITNAGRSEFAVRSVALIDLDNTVFASGDINELVPLNATKAFSINGIIPPATKGKTLYYKACFMLSSLDQTTQSCENFSRRLYLQNNIESGLTTIYILLSLILLVIIIFFLAMLRKLTNILDKKGR